MSPSIGTQWKATYDQLLQACVAHSLDLCSACRQGGSGLIPPGESTTGARKTTVAHREEGFMPLLHCSVLGRDLTLGMF